MTTLAHVTLADLAAAKAKAATTNHTYSYAGMQDGSLLGMDAPEAQKVLGMPGATIAEMSLQQRQNRLAELGGVVVAGDPSNPRDLPWWFDATDDPANHTLHVAPSWTAEEAFRLAGLLGWDVQLIDAELRWTYRTGERVGRRTYRKVRKARHIVIPDGVFGPEPVFPSPDIVSDEWQLWTNEDMLALLQAVREHEAATIDAVGHYGTGAHAFAAIRLSDTKYTIPGLDDPGSLFLVFDTSYTGVESSSAYFSYVRHRCRNTATIGAAEAVARVNMVHRGNMTDKGPMAVNLLRESVGAMDLHAVAMGKLAKIDLTVRQVEQDIAPKVFPYTAGQKGKTSADPAKAGEQARRVVDRKRARFVTAFADSPSLEGLPRSAYTARQALSESAEHQSDTRTQRARLAKVTTPTGDVVRLLHSFDLLFPAQTGAVRKPKRQKATNTVTLY
jgi:hypothetical protein